MLDVLYYKAFIKSNFLIIFIILTSNQIKTCLCVREDTCRNVTSYNNIECFNDKIEFHENFRAGHFETLKDGTLIIEYSKENYGQRLFYGLKKNGRYYFPGESPVKTFEAYNPLQNGHNYRFESKNKIIYLSGDINKEKEYLFSTSSYTSVTELHDIERNLSNYWDTSSFWEIVEIFSYEIIILDLQEGNEIHYLCIFTQRETDIINGETYSKTFSIRKFKFDDFNNYTIIGKVDNSNHYNSRVISAFIIYNWAVIVVSFLKKVEDENNNKANYTIAFYKYDLVYRNEINRCAIDNACYGYGLFFRSFLIKELDAVFLYFKDVDGVNICFEVGKLTLDEGGYNFSYKISLIISGNRYSSYIMYNDFFKVDDTHFVFVTSQYPYRQINLLLFDLYNNYWNYKIRSYQYNDIEEGLKREIQGYTYNGYIILSFSQSDFIFSTLLFFGYANGTDFEIDISLYLMDTGYYNQNNNLYERLIESCVIDNNIFGYEIVPKINLVSYPDEILFYNGTGDTKESNPLPFNSFFDAHHSLYQNKELNKTNEKYFLEYQFIVKEPDYDNFYSTPPVHEIFNDNFGYNFEADFEPKIFFGRTNKLYFKMCHNYCESCNELGIEENETKCLKCLDNYTFDYWHYLNKDDFYCIPEGYFFYKETGLVTKCDNIQYKFFTLSNEKNICFKYEYDCPHDFPYFNSTNNECLNFSVATSIITQVPTSFSYSNPSTMPTIIQTTSVNIIQTDFQIIIPKTLIKNEIITTTFTTEFKDINSINETNKYYINDINGFLIKFNNYLNISKNLENIDEDKIYQEFQIDNNLLRFTSTKYLKNNPNINETTINLGLCENILKQAYNISNNTSLYLLIIDVEQEGMKIPKVEYEVYNINNEDNFMLLNLSLCKNIKIDISIPVEINDNIDKYNASSGYYNDLCYQTKSIYGTDICLEDRRDEFIKNNLTLCEENCELSDYDYIYKKAKCSCEIKIKIPLLEEIKVDKEKLKNKFIDINNIANINFLKCYEIVFTKENLIKNLGFYILGFIMILFIICLFFFYFKFYKLLLIRINSNFIDIKKDNKIEHIITTSIKEKNIQLKSEGDNNKKIKIEETKIKKKKKKKKKNRRKSEMKNNYIDKGISDVLTIKDKTEKSLDFQNKKRKPFIKEVKQENNKNLDNDTLDYDDLELNSLSYEEAFKLDKRTYIQYYISLLKINHLLIFSFYPNKDYNSPIIKAFLFFFCFASDLTVNALFFTDDTMHQIYSDKGSFNFIYQIPQILYSSLISIIVKSIIKFLSLSEEKVVELKEEKRKNAKNFNEKIERMYKTLKIKFILFFIITFIILFFFWFYITCFCGIYKYTQIHLIKDSLSSFTMSLVYPFCTFLLPGIFRKFALGSEKMDRKFVYKLSQLLENL